MVQRGARRPEEENQVISGHTRQDLKPDRPLLKSGEALTLFQGSVEPEVAGAEGCGRACSIQMWCERAEDRPLLQP